MESQIAGLKEEISFAGSLSDPRIGFGLMNIPTATLRFDREPMTQKQFFIAQKVPWFGKLSLKSQRAALRAIRQEAVLSAKKLSLEKQIATTYYELGFVASSQKINKRLFSLVSQLLKVSETRYATGRGLQQDVLQAQVELSKLLNERIMLAKKRRIMEDRINALLNRESFSPINPPKALHDLNLILKMQDLKSQMMKQHPWLHVRKAEIDQATIEIELAKKDYLPDMDFKLAYGQRDTSYKDPNWGDFISASVAMKVPFWHKTRQDKKLAATREKHQATLSRFQNLATSLPHRVDALANEIRSLQENYRLFKDALIVQAAQWAQSSLSAYEVGKLEFNSMLHAQMRLLRIELTADKYLFDIHKKRAELEEIIGGPLPEQHVGSTPLSLHNGKQEAQAGRPLSMVTNKNLIPYDNKSIATWENNQ
jgi:outer membrane protein TolC